MKSIGLISLFLFAFVLAACSSAAAAQPAEPAPVAASAPDAFADPQEIVDGPRPDVAITAPVFHQVDAKRILPSRLVIPDIKVDTPVVELGWTTKKSSSGTIFSEWDVAEYAAGWHKNSVVPGEPGNVVMSGHNNILGSVFRELDRLKPGDAIEVYSGGAQHDYVVDEVLIVPEKYASLQQRKANARYIQTFEDDRLTLVSCWPRDDNTHRIVVIARPAGGNE